MKTKNIEQRVRFDVPPQAVYEALVDSEQHAQFTGDAAKIRARPGAAFTCYGDYISGFTLELEPGRRIVQAWRSRNWPAGHYSVVTFVLGARPGGKTELRFTQLGVPADDYADKTKGWRTHYWEPLRTFLEA